MALAGQFLSQTPFQDPVARSCHHFQAAHSREFGVNISAPRSTASHPQSLAIFRIADEIARNFCCEKQIWPLFIAKRIATATVSLPQKKKTPPRIWTICGHHLQLLNEMKPSKIAAYNFDRVTFRTKNAMALEAVVFYYCRSVLLSIRIRCHLPPEKSAPSDPTP